MNYLSHAYRHLHDPYFVAGVALPDWLRILGREFRVRRNRANELIEKHHLRIEHSEPKDGSVDVGLSPEISFYRGIIQHHHDDGWFHQTEAFVLLSAKLAVELREIHGPDASIRSHFLGHIIVELLLDSLLVDRNENLLSEYYRAIESLDRQRIVTWTEHLLGRSVPKMEHLLVRFAEERFLADYVDDDRLLFRLNQVMKRVGLAQLGAETLPWIAKARVDVRDQFESLMTAE